MDAYKVNFPSTGNAEGFESASLKDGKQEGSSKASDYDIKNPSIMYDSSTGSIGAKDASKILVAMASGGCSQYYEGTIDGNPGNDSSSYKDEKGEDREGETRRSYQYEESPYAPSRRPEMKFIGISARPK